MPKWRTRIVQNYRKHCPEGRIVAIANEPTTAQELGVDDLVYGMEGAEALVAAVEQAFSNSGSAKA
jgi:hypothetical protein